MAKRKRQALSARKINRQGKQKAKATKQVQRAKHGSLKENLVTPITLTRYRGAIRLVLYWLHTMYGLNLPTSFVKLDEIIMDFLESLWHEGEPLGIGETSVASFQYYVPSARGQLKGAWDLLKVWRRLEPPCRTPPWPRKLFLAIVGVLVKMNCLGYAMAILVGYDCCLRTVEMCNLRSSHFICLRNNVIVWLGVCKTEHKDNRLDSIAIECAQLKKLTLRWRQAQGSQDFPLVENQNHFRRTMKTVLAILKVEHMGFQLYGVRRGSATNVFGLTASFDAVCERGRWSSVKSMRMYVNQAMQALTEMKFTDESNELMKQASNKINWSKFRN